MSTVQDRNIQAADPTLVQQLMDAIPNPVFYKNKDCIYTGCNKAFETYLGKKRDEIIGKGVFDMAPKDLAEKYHAQDMELLNTGMQQIYEAQVRYADGTLHDVIFNKAVFKGLDDSPAGIVGIILDISERKKAETALKMSESRYRAMVENINDVIYSADMQGLLTYVSPAIERISHYSPSELIGKPFTDIIHPDDLPAIISRFVKLLEGEIAASVFRILDKDRSVIHVRSHSRPVYEKDRLVGITGTITDITDQIKAEEALKKNEQKYRDIINSIQETYYEVDLNGDFILLNSSVTRHMGYSPEEMIGKNFSKVMDARNMKKVFETFHNVFITGEPVAAFEYETIAKNGTVLPVEASVSPCRDSNGKTIGFGGVIRVITERHKIQEILRQSEEKYRTILESIQEGYYEVNLQGRFTFINEACCVILGYAAEDILGSDYSRYMDNDTARKIFKAFNKMFVTGKPDTGVDWEIHHKDGTRRTVEASMSLIRDGAGQPAGFRGIMRDITSRKQAEQNLRESEGKLQAIVDSTLNAIAMIDTDGIITLWNAAAERIFGYSPDEVMNLNLHNLIVPGHYHAAHSQAFARFISSGKGDAIGKVLELTGLHKDGHELVIELSLSSVQIGGKWHAVGVMSDISKRNKVEKSLRESEERYRSLFENVSDLIFFHDLDGNLDIDKCNFRSNPKWANLVERMGSTNLIDMLPENIRGIFHEVMTQLVKDRVGKGVITLVDKQGEKSHLEYWHQVFYDEHGKAWVQSIARDITEKLLAERALAKSEEKYRTILQSIDDGYFETDEKGNISFINEAFCTILKSAHEMIIGKNISGLTDEQTALKLLETLNKIFVSGNPERGLSMELTCKDFSTVSTESTISLMRDKKGKKSGFRGVMRDITERKKLEQVLLEKNITLEGMQQEMEQTNLDLILAYTEVKESQIKLVQSEKMATIGQLAAGVAHEINNPMGFITSNLGSLGKYAAKMSEFLNLQDQAISSGNQEILASIPEKRTALKIDYILKDIDNLVAESLDGAQRVKKIVLDLKSFSRMDEPELNFADINSCIESSLNMVWSEVKYKAQVVKELGVIPETLCFAQQLNQVIINLLVNASQAMETMGEIRIKTWEENGSIFVAISDTGNGIPEENLPKLFEPFFTTKAKDKGTGLGLAIVCDIVRKHNGDIKVESVLNQGTTFTIEIPVMTEKEPS